MDAAGMAAGSPAGRIIPGVEGARQIDFATLPQSRAIGAIAEMIFDFLKPAC